MDERIAVVGAGQMGNGIAHVFAQSGFPVTMIDVSREALERGQATIRKNLERQVKKGTMQPDASAETLARIALSESLDAAKEATLVVGKSLDEVSLTKVSGSSSKRPPRTAISSIASLEISIESQIARRSLPATPARSRSRRSPVILGAPRTSSGCTS